MVRERSRRRRVPTVWQVPDDLWNRVAILLPIGPRCIGTTRGTAISSSPLPLPLGPGGITADLRAELTHLDHRITGSSYTRRFCGLLGYRFLF